MTITHPIAARTATERFRQARDLLLDLRGDHEAARARFEWPQLSEFNWALDWLDHVARDNNQPALRVVGKEADRTVSYAELSERSSRVANWLRANGIQRGDRVLMMLDNDVTVWEAVLAAMKIGAVVIPTFTTVSADDLADRVRRGAVKHVITMDLFTDSFAELPGHVTRICVGERVAGWLRYDEAYLEPALFTPDAPTMADDPLFLYFTSGTTSRPKLVQHTHVSYPVGHLSGMYWNGVRPGDVHLNVSAPGWAKHAWSSFFVPLNAEATVVSLNNAGPTDLLDQLVKQDVSTFCAPPTVWRMLIQHDLGQWPVTLREAGSVGEPLNPEVVEQVRQAWGITVRDGYGQTETTAQIGNTPGLPVKPGSMGKPLPGYDIVLVDPNTGEPADEGEICVRLSERSLGVMPGYLDDPEKNAKTFAGGYYHTGDIGHRDSDGYIFYVGRTDDVFKSYDHRVSPFELESVLLEHESVAEAAVIPAPDPIGMFVPKAYVSLTRDGEPSVATAKSILTHCRDNLAPHKWIRRLEFAALPKTTSGKIRRAELRARDREGTEGTEYLAEELLGATGPSAPGLG
ncbi:AMP-binding protein [Actinophytocola sp.]|uniref:AMP-binding protein n=1 Tax=Actinophytocola sp. TaxID=1872138 RepID=UPI002ED15501